MYYINKAPQFLKEDKELKRNTTKENTEWAIDICKGAQYHYSLGYTN